MNQYGHSGTERRSGGLRPRLSTWALAVLLAGAAMGAHGAIAAEAATAPSPSPTVSPTPSPSPTPKPAKSHAKHPAPTPAPSGAPSGAQAQDGGGDSAAPSATPAATPSAQRGDDTGRVPESAATAGDAGAAPGRPVAPAVSTSPGHATPPTHAPGGAAPFAPLGSAPVPNTVAVSLDGTRIPPVIALTPMSGLDFGTGMTMSPLLVLLDVAGLVCVCQLVRRNWAAPPA